MKTIEQTDLCACNLDEAVFFRIFEHSSHRAACLLLTLVNWKPSNWKEAFWWRGILVKIGTTAFTNTLSTLKVDYACYYTTRPTLSLLHTIPLIPKYRYNILLLLQHYMVDQKNDRVAYIILNYSIIRCIWAKLNLIYAKDNTFTYLCNLNLVTAVFFTTVPQILHFAANLLFSRRYESKERWLYSRWILRPPGPFFPLRMIFNVDFSASELWLDNGIGFDIVFNDDKNQNGKETKTKYDNCSKICSM